MSEKTEDRLPPPFPSSSARLSAAVNAIGRLGANPTVAQPVLASKARVAVAQPVVGCAADDDRTFERRIRTVGCRVWAVAVVHDIGGFIVSGTCAGADACRNRGRCKDP